MTVAPNFDGETPYMKRKARNRAKNPDAPQTAGRTASWEPTKADRELVETLAAMGTNQDIIARLVKNPYTGKGISKATLHSYFEEELSLGLAKANANIAKSLYKAGIDGNITAMIFWLKTRGQGAFVESQEHRHTGPGGAPLQAPVFVVPGAVPPEQWEEWSKKQQAELLARPREGVSE